MKVLEGGLQAWKKAGYPVIERSPVSSLLGRILVPLDGSVASEAVLYQAERLLCGRKSEVVLFHALDSTRPAFPAPKAAEDYLRSVEDRLRSGGAESVRHLLLEGPVAQTLTRSIEAERVSLVALSSHGGRSTPETSLSGIVESVLRDSRAPLFVARAYERASAGHAAPARCEPSLIRRILVPLDGSSACEAVMPYARDLGRLLGALIVILHASGEKRFDSGDFTGQTVSGRPEGAPPGREASPEERIEYAAKTFSAAGLETMTLTLGGDPLSTILEFARPSAVDLVAMTTHGRTGLSKLLMGSVAEKVLREAVLPTLLVRSDSTEGATCLP